MRRTAIGTVIPVLPIGAMPIRKIMVLRSGKDHNNLSFHRLDKPSDTPTHGTSDTPTHGTCDDTPTHETLLSLPFVVQKNECIACGYYRGLLHFDLLNGNIIVCNPSLKQYTFFPPPKKERRRDIILFEPAGFGYDFASRDFKIVRIFSYSYFDDEEKEKIYGTIRTITQVRGLQRDDDWRTIENPPPDVGALRYFSGCCVNGVYYWLTGFPLTEGCVLSFHFANEKFGQLPLPPTSPPTADYDFNLFLRFVDFNDELGVIVHKKPEDPEISTNCLEFWIWRGLSWVLSCRTTLDDVVRPPLAMIKYGVFLEVKSSDEQNQLAIWPLGGEPKKLEIYDNPETMEVFLYEESTFNLPDAKPMEHGVYPEVEEEEDSTDDENEDDEDATDDENEEDE